jgi:hypothetical protein
MDAPKFPSNELDFQHVMPHLELLYRRGALVPFIGSGMSFPECTGWVKFIERLAVEAEVDKLQPPSDLRSAPAGVLYRLAENIVTALRAIPPDERANRYRRALRPGKADGTAEITPQTRALAELYWPLVLTTNYDDLYLFAQTERSRPDICGRSRDDCHRVAPLTR